MQKNKIVNWLPYLIVIIAITSLFSMSRNAGTQTLSYSDLKTVMSDETIDAANVSIGGNITTIKLLVKDANDKSITVEGTIPSTNDEIADTLKALDKKEAKVTIIDAAASNVFVETLISLIPFVLMAGLAVWMINRMNGSQSANGKAFEFSQSRAKLEGKIRVRFTDVAGCDEEKQEMAEIIEYLKYPKKFEKMGARIPKGILLAGHPGTGKTLLAKAVAGEANVPFYSISGSDFVEMFVGVGASRVRDMFKKAQQTAPCIIFIDEIDAVGRQRGAGFGGGHDEREQTLNQLLVEMDGMEENTGVVVIAATNRPDVLDPALLRAGRFDRQITVALPDRKGREAILAVHARNKHFAADMDLGALAKRTPGFSGADLENVLNESAIMAVRHNETEITMADVDEAIDRVMMGPAKVSRTYDEKTKKLVAYHESGHAIVGLFMENAQVVQKVTIIPRGQAGGYNLMTPKEEKMLETKNDLLATITSFMGGRVSEEIYFDDVTTGASNDIERATNLAKDMVTLYGMSDLGPIKYNSGSENVFLGRDYNSANNVSGQVAFEIDQEVRKIVNQCHDAAKTLLEKHKTELESIANALIEHETLTAEQINRLVKGEDISADFIVETPVAPTTPAEPTTPTEVETAKEAEEPKKDDNEPKVVPLTTEDDAKDASFKDGNEPK